MNMNIKCDDKGGKIKKNWRLDEIEFTNEKFILPNHWTP